MPFVRTSVPHGTTADKKQRIAMAIHEGLVSAISMPQDELFNQICEYNKNDFFYSKSFNGISRSENFIAVEITMRRGRSDAMKRNLYADIVKNISETAHIDPRDVFIFLHENDYSDWSVGNGVFAMTLTQQRGID